LIPEAASSTVTIACVLFKIYTQIVVTSCPDELNAFVTGGILFEIATNPSGFTIDEKEEELGTHLMLPEWLESVRKDLGKVLPKVNLPGKKKKELSQVSYLIHRH
jgi:hypothetical protein